MPATNARDDFDPLPVADRQSELERRSVVAFNAALPHDKFKFRDERTDDAGVDASLELLINSRSTNLRAQIQLKATDKPKFNGDESLSLQVNTSNLNYLLNGQSPLYVLFDATSNQLFFAWARDERKRLDQINPHWMQQETVTLRFSTQLTSDTFDEIHNRVLREARLQRRIHDILTRASTTEQVIIGIDPKTLFNTDPDEIYKFLMASGTTFISSGFAALTLDLFDTLNPAQARSPRMEMIRAFAFYSLGKYQAARGHAAEALLLQDELSSDDQQFIGYLKDACDFNCGILDLNEYTQRQETRAAQQTDSSAQIFRLEYVRYVFSAERDRDRRQELFVQIRFLADSIMSFPDASDQSKIQARLTLLHAEGTEAVSELMRELMYFQMRLRMGYEREGQRYIEVLDKRFGQWEQDMKAVLAEAIHQTHPILTGDALNTWVGIRVFKLTVLRTMPNAFSQIPEDVIHANMRMAEEAIGLHSLTGSLESELNAKMLLAELFELAEQNEAAKAIATGLLPKVQAMGYFGLEMRAKAQILGDTLLSRGKTRNREIDNTDQDLSIFERSDDEIRQLARSTLEAIGLPNDRLPVMERG